MAVFNPPTVNDVPSVYVEDDPYRPVPAIAQRLFARYGPRARGRSVLKISGTYATYDTPTQAQIDSASEVYLGGHSYVVDAGIAAALTSAGYGSNLS